MTNALQVLDRVIEAEKGNLAAAIPPQLQQQAERFFAVTYSACRDSEVARCKPDTVIGALFQAFRMGLLPDKTQGALVRFGSDCTFIPMYQGLVDCARRAGIREPHAEVVYLEDEFSIELGTDRKLTHRPELDPKKAERNLDDALGAYCTWISEDGVPQFEWVPAADILAIEKQVLSRGRGNSPWNGPFRSQQFKKTAIRRAAKKWPMDDAVRKYIREEDELYNQAREVEPEPAQEPQSGPPRTLADLAGGAEAAQEPAGEPQTIDATSEPAQGAGGQESAPEAAQASDMFDAAAEEPQETAQAAPQFVAAGSPTKDVCGLPVATEALPWTQVQGWETGSKGNQYLKDKTWGQVAADLGMGPILGRIVEKGIDIARRGQQVPVQFQCAALALQQINAQLDMQEAGA